MAITANKKFWTEFIEIYHNLPSLWNTKDENYNNRESRSLAWNKLVEKLQEVEPHANQESVKRKINTFRSNFNREVRKIRHTEKEQPTEVYNPTLWYFEHLSFLLNQEKDTSNCTSTDSHYNEEITLIGLTTIKSDIPENAMINSGTLNQNETTDNDKNSHYVKEEKNCSILNMITDDRSKFSEAQQEKSVECNVDFDAMQNQTSPPVNHLSMTSQISSSADNYNSCVREKSVETQNETGDNSACLKRSKLRLKSQDPYNRHFRNKFSSSILTDEAAIYGQAWAYGFRKLSPQQKLFAKKAIDEILILGQLKALKLKTVPMDINFLEDTSNQG